MRAFPNRASVSVIERLALWGIALEDDWDQMAAPAPCQPAAPRGLLAATATESQRSVVPPSPAADGDESDGEVHLPRWTWGGHPCSGSAVAAAPRSMWRRRRRLFARDASPIDVAHQLQLGVGVDSIASVGKPAADTAQAGSKPPPASLCSSDEEDKRAAGKLPPLSDAAGAAVGGATAAAVSLRTSNEEDERARSKPRVSRAAGAAAGGAVVAHGPVQVATGALERTPLPILPPITVRPVKGSWYSLPASPSPRAQSAGPVASVTTHAPGAAAGGAVFVDAPAQANGKVNAPSPVPSLPPITVRPLLGAWYAPSASAPIQPTEPVAAAMDATHVSGAAAGDPAGVDGPVAAATSKKRSDGRTCLYLRFRGGSRLRRAWLSVREPSPFSDVGGEDNDGPHDDDVSVWSAVPALRQRARQGSTRQVRVRALHLAMHTRTTRKTPVASVTLTTTSVAKARTGASTTRQPHPKTRTLTRTTPRSTQISMARRPTMLPATSPAPPEESTSQSVCAAITCRRAFASKVSTPAGPTSLAQTARTSAGPASSGCVACVESRARRCATQAASRPRLPHRQ